MTTKADCHPEVLSSRSWEKVYYTFISADLADPARFVKDSPPTPTTITHAHLHLHPPTYTNIFKIIIDIAVIIHNMIHIININLIARPLNPIPSSQNLERQYDLEPPSSAPSLRNLQKTCLGIWLLTSTVGIFEIESINSEPKSM